MHKEKVGRTNIKIILLLTFAVLAVALFYTLDSRKNKNQQHHLQLVTERYQRAYNTIYDQYKQLAENIYSGMLPRFKIQDVYLKLLTADKEQKNRLRQELLDQTKQRYEKLQQGGLVRQLQFHLPNNKVFLRLHLPDKFGDDLTGIRHTVEYVNSEHVTINGFENGRTSGSYRFVFPITAADQTYLGSMEISFGPEVLTSAIMKQYHVLSNFFVAEKYATKNSFPNERKEIYKKSHHKGYFYNKNVLAALKQVSRKEMKELKPQENITDGIYANAHSAQATSLYDPSIDMVFTTIPVLNPVTLEMVAFCTVRSQSDFFMNERQHFRLIFLLSLLLLSMSLLTFYVQYNQRKTLETHTKKLEKQRQQLLKTQKVLQQERDMFMNGPVITFTWQNNENWQVEQVSANVIDILGYSAEEFINGSVQYATLIHPDDLQRVADEVASNSAPEISSFTHEPYRLKTRAGDLLWVIDNTTLVRNNQGEITHFKGYLVDITMAVLMEKEVIATKESLKRNRQEEQFKRFESLKTMAGAIAHRFNNAMMAVLGNLEIMALTLSKNSDERKMVLDAQQAAKGASQVGTMMLSYVGQQPIKLQKLPLTDLVRESVSALKNLFYPEISFKFTPPVQPLHCSMDKPQIREVIENVLSNAIESLESGPGMIEISFGSEFFAADSLPIPFQGDHLQDGMYAFCQIKDSGCGISPDKLVQIFEPFYTTKFVGRGLGLALTVGILRTHHGAITIESTMNKGTTVRVLLPSIQSLQKKIFTSEDVVKSETVQWSGNILLADDEAMLLDVGRKMLELLGFTVHPVSDGQEAVDKINHQGIDFCAVVLDVSMPKMDGIEAMQAIRKIDSSLPILLSSGYSEDELSFNKDQGSQPDGFLSKPFQLSDMRSCLENILS